jgi:hypothetical protein
MFLIQPLYGVKKKKAPGTLLAPMQSVHITSKVTSLNPEDGEMYSIQHYMTEFVSDLRQVFCFLQVMI